LSNLTQHIEQQSNEGLLVGTLFQVKGSRAVFRIKAINDNEIEITLKSGKDVFKYDKMMVYERFGNNEWIKV